MDNFRGDAKISIFIYRICINTAQSNRAKLNRSKKRLVPLDGKVFIQPEKDKTQDEQLKKLYAAIREFKTVDRAIIGLYLEEKSYEEIAEIMGISKTNVATRLMRLKRKIIERFNNE
jgi:RNA polymerase sigma-70 factor (ECF subfamily)